MKNFEIEITKKPQLINLNDSEKNFEIKFKVVSENEKEFLAIVLNKEDLDKYSDLDELEMKKSPGIIKGTLQCNDDKTENYFLVLKKEGEPCKATVEIDINEIEKFEEIDQFASSQQPVKDNSVAVIFNKYFYHILGFLIVVSLIYYFYSKKITIKSIPAAITEPVAKSTVSATSVPTPLSQTTVPAPSVSAPLSQSTVPGPSVSAPSVVASATPSSSIELGGTTNMSPSLQSGLTILDKLATSPNC